MGTGWGRTGRRVAVGARDTPRSRSAHLTGREQATASPRRGSEREKPSFHKAALKKGEAREMHDFQNEQGRPAPRLTPGAPELLGRRLRSPAQGWDRRPATTVGPRAASGAAPRTLFSLSLSLTGEQGRSRPARLRGGAGDQRRSGQCATRHASWHFPRCLSISFTLRSQSILQN